MPALGGQMFLADVIASISFLAILILYASYVTNQRPPSSQLYIFVTFFSFVAIWSSITIVIPFIIATAFFFLMISPTIKETNQNIIGRDTAIFLVVETLKTDNLKNIFSRSTFAVLTNINTIQNTISRLDLQRMTQKGV